MAKLPEHLPYTVQNNRPRRLVLVHGRYLAPVSKGGTSTMHLSEKEFLHESVQELLRVGRLVCIRSPIQVLEPDELTSFEDHLKQVEIGHEVRRLLETEPEGPTPDVEELTKGWSQEELEELGFRDLQALAKELDLPSGGTAAELVKRILASQEVKSGS